jgi:hypothetical protein
MKPRRLFAWRSGLLTGLAAAACSGAVLAADIEASRGSELLQWVQQAYETVRDKLAASREREAKAALMKEKQQAETDAIKACANAVNLRAQIACIEPRSTAFANKYSKRATPEELRFAVLVELQARLARATPKRADDGMALVQRISALCSSGAVPRSEQAQCLKHAQDCVGNAATNRAASAKCLQALEAFIDSAGSAGPGPQRKAKGGECVIFDDPVQSDALAQRDPERHLRLLTECGE